MDTEALIRKERFAYRSGVGGMVVLAPIAWYFNTTGPRTGGLVLVMGLLIGYLIERRGLYVKCLELTMEAGARYRKERLAYGLSTLAVVGLVPIAWYFNTTGPRTGGLVLVMAFMIGYLIERRIQHVKYLEFVMGTGGR